MKPKSATIKAIASLLAAVVLSAALPAQASVFSVTNSNNRFFVSRSDASTTETVYYRLVALSAYPGKHFAAQNPLQYHMTFPVNMRENSVDIQEYSADVIDRAFLYYLDNGETGSSRTYRFEVYNEDGVQLATANRTITYGDASLSVSRSVFDEKSVTVSSDEITVKDKGYGQAYHEVPLDAYFSGVSKNYLMRTDSRLRMVVDLQAAEIDDGYQYIQVLANESSAYDSGAEDGNPGSINRSCYMAGFSHYDEGTLPDFRKYTFPLVSAVNGCGKVEKAWNDSAHGNNTAGDLFNQRFKDGWRADDGRIAIPTEIRYLNKLGIRFDASGGGDDDWKAKSVVARLQAVPVAPALLDDVEIAVTAAPVCKGSTLTISLPFNQIMTVSGTPYLCTSWGDLKYAAGSGSNVITFSDTVTAGAGTELVVSGISSGGSVESLTGALFQFLNNVSVGGRTLDPLPEPPKDGDYYMLSTPSHFLWFADRIETNSTARAALAADIDLSGIHSFRSMGGECGFAGVLDGRGHTLSGLNSVKCDFPNSCLGLFWQIAAQGVVTNLVLADVNVRCSSLCLGIGALCALNYGTITHCTVSGLVSTTMSGYDTFSTKMGGICSENYGTIRACQFVASPLDPETPSLVNLWPILSVGGIAGRNNSGGLIEGCLFYALYSDYFKGDTTRGAICSRNFGTVRNCVGLHDSRSWIDGCFGEDSGASSNVLFLDAGTPFAGGQACYALNGGVTDGSQPWYQVIGADALPRLSCTPVRGATVYPFGDGYGNRVASDWDWLQMQLDAGGIVALAEDVTAEDGNSSLTVTNRVVLDLAGHTIDAAGRFRAIQIDNGGELTLTNSVNGSGAITGGNSTYGGGLFVSHYGTFTMTGGTISGNKASYGSGVYVSGGTFTMTGGAITGNACGSDGAVRMSGTCTVSGGPIIFGNTNFNGAASNVWMGYDDKIAVNGLSAGASIGVMTSRTPTESSPVTFATGASPGDDKYFFSDDPGSHVERDGGELLLVPGAGEKTFWDPEGRLIEDYAVVKWLSENGFTQADIDALGKDSAATDKLYECWVLNLNFKVQDAGATLSFTDITVSNRVSMTVQLVRKAPLAGCINGYLYIYGANDLAAGFDRDPIPDESVEYFTGDPYFNLVTASNDTVTQTAVATLNSSVTAKFFKAEIGIFTPYEPEDPWEPEPEDPEPEEPEE